jgi:hypothetical protein
MDSHPALDHAIVHGGHHAGRVRIVPNDEVQQATADLLLLFPHTTSLKTAVGCCHTCVYTDDSPPSLVAERIAEHARLFDHATGEPRPQADPGAREGLGKGAAIT